MPRTTCYGEVEIGEARRTQLSGEGRFAVVVPHVYRPHHGANLAVPPQFEVHIESLRYPGGARRFQLAGDTSLLSLATGGCAILESLGMSAEDRNWHALLNLMYQHRGSVRERLNRRFRSGRDLSREVLPASLGLAADGSGCRWDVNRLFAEGAEAAHEVGYDNPTSEQQFDYGLFAAALRNPVDVSTLSPTEASNLMRTLLFDGVDGAGPVDDEVLEVVARRLLIAIHKHRKCSAERFRKWFFERRAVLIRQIAGRSSDGHRIGHALVRQAMVELVFRSYGDLSRLLHLQLRDFAAALPKPLTRSERRIFDAIYAPQPALGGISPILLGDRFPTLRGALNHMLHAPGDAPRQGVLLRLMMLRAEIVRNRREADRRSKKKVRTASFVTAGDTTKQPHLEGSRRLAKHVGERLGLSCACEVPEQWNSTVQDAAADPVTIELRCDHCGWAIEVAVARQELRTPTKS